MINAESYIGLVCYHADGFNLPSHKDDLIGAGMIGLVEAAKRFNPRHKAKFATYAARRIRGAMQDYLRIWAGAGRRRRNSKGGHLLDLRVIPLDIAFGGNGNGGRNLEPGTPEEPNLKHARLFSEIIGVMQALCSEQEIDCMKRRFKDGGMTQKAIGKEIGLSESRVCQILGCALRKLRAHYRTD